MTKYHVHIYREMRLKFDGIEADTPEAAAAIARDKLTDDADDIEDCNGDDFSALIDVVGDDQYERSVAIDFEAERQRKAAPKLLTSLGSVIGYAEAEAYSLEKHKDSPEAEAEAKKAWEAIETAHAVIAEANATGITPAPGEIDIDALLAGRRQIAVVWSIEDVQEVRPDLSDEQAWEVLQAAKDSHQADIGIDWSMLEGHAEMLIGPAPDEPEEE